MKRSSLYNNTGVAGDAVTRSTDARDAAAAKRLWEASETLAAAQSQKERATG